MFVEFLEYLRCPRTHEESPLIVAATRAESRHIIAGTLGCPVCHAEFGIIEGEAVFDREAAPAPPEPPDADLAMRIAAFLQLTDTRGVVALAGRWANHAAPLRELVDIPLLLVNPSGAPFAAEGIVRVGGVMPLAASLLRGAAIDETVSPELTASIVRCVRPRGRMVGPVSQPLPQGITELVRDDRHWVAEKTAAPDHDPAPRLVPLKRASG